MLARPLESDYPAAVESVAARDESRIPRTLVWTRSGPEEPSGSPAILDELLARFPLGSVEVVCEQRTPQNRWRAFRSPHPVHRLPMGRNLWPMTRGDRVRNVLRHALAPQLIQQGLKLIHTFRPQVLLSIFSDELWITSSFVLSKLSHVPIVYYVHDPWEESTRLHKGLSARWAKYLEPKALRHGSIAVLFPSLAHRYRDKYGIDPVVIRHPAGTARKPFVPQRRDGRLVVGFSGTIYSNNTDCVTALAEAVRTDPRLSLRIFSNASRSKLESLGATGDRVTASFISDPKRLYAELGQCDLLYLPLSFTGQADLPTESLRDVLPTKAVDYLMAGPPILVHCPASYELARFFRESKSAHVLHEPGAKALGQFFTQFAQGAVEPLSQLDVERAAAEFDADANFESMVEVLHEACRKSL